MKKSVIIAGLFIALSCTSVGTANRPVSQPLDQRFAMNLAQELDDHYRRRGVNTSAKVIWETTDECQKMLGTFFPDGKVSLDVLLAIAALESDFQPKALGIFGEKGLFQILRSQEALDSLGIPKANPFDVRTNVRMGALVLRDKYTRHGDLRKAIIAYNGVVKRRDGTWDDQYLLKFRKKHAMVLRMMRKAQQEG